MIYGGETSSVLLTFSLKKSILIYVVYEESKNICMTEVAIALSGEIVTDKVVLDTIRHDYDSEGRCAVYMLADDYVFATLALDTAHIAE